jgi:hypothetical protein
MPEKAAPPPQVLAEALRGAAAVEREGGVKQTAFWDS